MRILFHFVPGLVLLLAACGDSKPADMGATDAGTDSAPGMDSGMDAGGDGGHDAGPSDAGFDGGGPDDAAVHHIQTVFVLVFENHSWSDVVASSSSTYIQSLLPMGARAAMYQNPPHLHPSEPNYLWMEAGSNFGVTNDNDPGSNHQSTTDHLVTYLDAAGISWKSYQEDIDGATCPLTSTGFYAPKHNPMVFFDDVTGTNDPASANCIAHVRPFTELAGDLSAGTVARYNFITPNLCNDMHGATGCPSSDLVGMGDTWLSTNLPPILAYAAAHDGAVFVTWDESEIIDVPIGMIVLGPYAKTNFTETSTGYTHGSLLRTLQDIFGVGPYLRDAALQQPLSNLFTSYP